MDNGQLLKKYGSIFLYNNSHIEKIIINKNNNSTIRAITINSLREEIENFKPKPYKYFIHKGLNKKLNPKNIITLILRNKTRQELLKFYSFNNIPDIIENDIPFFHPDVPDGYSLFCSQLEYEQLMNFLKNKENDKKEKKEEEEEEIFESEPIPCKRHFICQICKCKFNNYKEHVNSKFHFENNLKYRNIFMKMKLTFKKISYYNEKKKNKNNINELQEHNNKMYLIDLKSSEEVIIKSSYYITLDNINNETTRYDSFLNDENKDINKKDLKAGIVITKKGKEKLSEKGDENISIKDILNILDSIDDKSKLNSGNIKKRKKNEKNKYYFNENYIFDLKRITGKISYYKSIYKNE